MGTHVAGAGVPHFLVEADVQVVAGLVGQEEADGDGRGGGRQADVDLHLGLQDPQLPEAAAVAHHHGPYRLLDLGTGQLVGASAAPGTSLSSMLSLEKPHCTSTSADIFRFALGKPLPPSSLTGASAAIRSLHWEEGKMVPCIPLQTDSLCFPAMCCLGAEPSTHPCTLQQITACPSPRSLRGVKCQHLSSKNLTDNKPPDAELLWGCQINPLSKAGCALGPAASL